MFSFPRPTYIFLIQKYTLISWSSPSSDTFAHVNPSSSISLHFSINFLLQRLWIKTYTVYLYPKRDVTLLTKTIASPLLNNILNRPWSFLICRHRKMFLIDTIILHVNELMLNLRFLRLHDIFYYFSRLSVECFWIFWKRYFAYKAL